jgi:hypothetical protein
MIDPRLAFALSPSRLVPDGFHVESAEALETGIVARMRDDRPTAAFPACASHSGSIHSCYIRQAAAISMVEHSVTNSVLQHGVPCKRIDMTCTDCSDHDYLRRSKTRGEPAAKPFLPPQRRQLELPNCYALILNTPYTDFSVVHICP